MADYGFKIKRQDVAKDVEDCEPKELIFSSKFPCAKILQTAKKLATGADTQEVVFSDVVAFPIVVLCYVYDSDTEDYTPVDIDYDDTRMYLPGLSKSAGSYFYIFVCYA